MLPSFLAVNILQISSSLNLLTFFFQSNNVNVEDIIAQKCDEKVFTCNILLCSIYYMSCKVI